MQLIEAIKKQEMIDEALKEKREIRKLKEKEFDQ